jgi:hypothetical protein
MSSTVRKSRRSLMDEELRSGSANKTTDQRIGEMVEFASLKDMPLEERRREANKPLFLARYE